MSSLTGDTVSAPESEGHSNERTANRLFVSSLNQAAGETPEPAFAQFRFCDNYHTTGILPVRTFAEFGLKPNRGFA